MKTEDIKVAFDVLTDLHFEAVTSTEISIDKSRAFDFLDGISQLAKEIKRQVELKGR